MIRTLLCLIFLLPSFSMAVDETEFKLEDYQDLQKELERSMKFSQSINEGNAEKLLVELDSEIDMYMFQVASVLFSEPNHQCAESFKIVLSEIKEYRNEYPSEGLFSESQQYKDLLQSIEIIPEKKPENKLDEIKSRLERMRVKQSCEEL